ncbi:MAG: hypothetical protein ACTSVI_11420 [Promethearchaeota archaeon]
MARKIYFTVFSQAYYVDMNWGFGCPSGGIKRMGDIFHNYDVPITWLVSPKSARCEQELLKTFHDLHGDEIAMMIRFNAPHHLNERIVANTLSVDDYRKLIRKEKEEIEGYLPWADIKIAAQGIRTQAMMQALLEEGFIGVHGHCYCQVGTDSITDYGSPWGSFRIRPDDYHLPARAGEQGMIAFEWTQRDLNRSFHTVYPELWSTDPNDVERGGVCTDDNVEWWKNMFIQYERALSLNENGIWFQFHQESHEMTWGEVCKPLTEARVMFTADMMDEFLDWLVQRSTVEFVTASEAVEKYNSVMNNGTIPMYFPFKWTDVPDDLPFWEQVRTRKGYAGHISKHSLIPQEELWKYLDAVNSKDPEKAMRAPPWLDSFFYYDDECQLVFDLGRLHPVAIFNYLNYQPSPDLIESMKNERGGGMPGFYLEEHVPEVKVLGGVDAEGHVTGDFTLKIENHREKSLPFGIFLWKEIYPNCISYFSSKLSSLFTRKGLKTKIVPDQGVFFRFNLDPGENNLVI